MRAERGGGLRITRGNHRCHRAQKAEERSYSNRCSRTEQTLEEGQVEVARTGGKDVILISRTASPPSGNTDHIAHQ
jgi:hypothetical protein